MYINEQLLFCNSTISAAKKKWFIVRAEQCEGNTFKCTRIVNISGADSGVRKVIAIKKVVLFAQESDTRSMRGNIVIC